MSIKEQLRQTIKKHNLLARGDKVLIGVSGGPDSLCLLYLLMELKDEWNLSLHLAHFDHALREKSSLDAAFIRTQARKLGLPATFGKVGDPAVFSQRGSLEELARNARFNFFFRLAKKLKANKIALGHNLDDQAETVLMRILRGSGLYGLRGILPKRKILGFTVIRPLLEVRRSQIEKYLKRKKIRALKDATNSSDMFMRNKIRHQLLPFLEKNYNRNIKGVLTNLAQCAGSDYDFLYSYVKKKLSVNTSKINLDKFLRLHPALQRLVLRTVIARSKGDTRRFELRHIMEIEDLVANRPLNSIVHLPGGIAAIKKSKNLLICHHQK